jgi:hypothetical protein
MGSLILYVVYVGLIGNNSVRYINFLCEIFKIVLNCTYIHVLYFYDLFHILLSSD